MSLVTPVLGLKGIWFVASPFVVDPNSIYECVAIRTFEEYERNGESVFKDVYEPVGLDETETENDRRESLLVTLKSETQPTVIIPTAYLERYPDQEYVEYGRILLSIDLGPIALKTPLNHLREELASVASDVIGTTPVVQLHTLSAPTVFSKDQHELIESARQDAITNRTSSYAKLKQAQAIIEVQATRIAALEEIVRTLQP